MITKFSDVFAELKASGTCKKLVAAWAVDSHTIEAASKADAPWRGKEGMTAEYSKHLAEVSIADALSAAARHALERAE